MRRMNLELNHNGKLTYKIIGLAMRVHRNLGPGLLESLYRRCLCHELSLADIPFEQEVYLPIHYNGMDINSGYRADMIGTGGGPPGTQGRGASRAAARGATAHLSAHQPVPARFVDELQYPVACRPSPGALTACLSRRAAGRSRGWCSRTRAGDPTIELGPNSKPRGRALTANSCRAPPYKRRGANRQWSGC